MFVSNLIKIFIVFLYNLFRRQIDAEFANPRLGYLRANSEMSRRLHKKTCNQLWKNWMLNRNF